MVDWCFSAAWQFSFVIWPVYEVGVFLTLEVTFLVDLKCLGIIRRSVILPTWCLFTGMFHFRTAFRNWTLTCLVAERTVFYTIRNFPILVLNGPSYPVLMSSVPFQLSQMVHLGCAAPRHWRPHPCQVSLRWLSSFLVFWRPRNYASLDLECCSLLKWPSSVSSVSSESCSPYLVNWSWNDRFSLWNRIFYQLKLLAF